MGSGGSKPAKGGKGGKGGKGDASKANAASAKVGSTKRSSTKQVGFTKSDSTKNIPTKGADGDEQAKPLALPQLTNGEEPGIADDAVAVEFISAEDEEHVEAEFEHYCTQVFEKADVDHNGTLDATELRSVLFSKTLGLNLSVEDADVIVEKFNTDGDDQIDYKEFGHMLRHLLVMVQEKVLHAENDWVLLEDKGTSGNVLYMNKRTGVCQHTKPLTFRDNVVEFVDFEEKQLLSGETVMVRPDASGAWEYIDFETGKWKKYVEAEAEAEDHVDSFCYQDHDTWFEQRDRSVALYTDDNGEEQVVPLEWLANQPSTKMHLEHVSAELGIELTDAKDRTLAMLALCHCNFDLDRTVVFITGNGFLTSNGAKLNPIQGLSDGDGSAEMAAMKDKLAKVEAEKEALATRSADLDRLLSQEKLKVERLEEQINRGTVRRVSLAISSSPTQVPKPSVPDKDFINAMIQLNKELMELKEVNNLNKTEMVELTNMVEPLVQNSITAAKKLTGAVVHASEAVTAKYKKEMTLRKRYFNTIQELKGNIRVFVRVRRDSNLTGKPVAIAASETEVSIRNLNETKLPKIMEFSRVYGLEAEQDEVFMHTKDTVTSVVDGFNVCIIAYGQTGSGKTWTMMGPENNPGVNRRAINELFALLDAQKQDVGFNIEASQVEVYNEGIYDLLSSKDRAETKIKPRLIKAVCDLPNLIWRDVITTEDVARVMADGDRNRSTASTAMNVSSSRSHLIFQLKVATTNKISGAKTSGMLTLVDLAGSERVQKSNVSGQGMVEAAAINKSLSALGMVFQSLSKNEPHVPYRNSALTQVLSQSLGGNAKCCMFANLSPLESNLAETISTLNFASNVTKVELGGAKKNKSR